MSLLWNSSLWVRLGFALLVLPLAVSSALASILGDTVQIEYLYPTVNTPYGISATGVVTAFGVRLNLFNNQEILVFPNAIDMLGINSHGSSFAGAEFNGISVTDLTNPDSITFISADPASDVVGFTNSDLSLIHGIVFINYEGLSTPFKSFARVEIGSPGRPHDSVLAASSSVPEPSTAPLVVTGLGLWLGSWLLWARARRRVTRTRFLALIVPH